MESIKDKETAIFQKLTAVKGEKNFCADGVIDEAIWNEMPIKILFLLKEAVGDPQKEDNQFSLTKFLCSECYKNRGVDRTWKNIERWTAEIINCSEYAEEVRALLGKEPNWLRTIAAANVKKHTGAAYTNTKVLKESFDQLYKECLTEQLQLYKDVNVIVCCGRGVMDCLASVFEQTFGMDCHACIKKTYTVGKKTIFSYKVNESLHVIDYWHPAARVSTKIKTQEIVDIINSFELCREK